MLRSSCSRASQGAHRTPKTSVPQSSSKSMAPFCLEANRSAPLWGLSRYFESDSLFGVSQRAGKVQGALADCSGRSCSIQRNDAKHCILSERQLGSVLRMHLQTSSCASRLKGQCWNVLPTSKSGPESQGVKGLPGALILPSLLCSVDEQC